MPAPLPLSVNGSHGNNAPAGIRHVLRLTSASRRLVQVALLLTPFFVGACSDVTGVRRAPSGPGFLAHAAPQDRSVHLTWSSVPGAIGYDIRWTKAGSAATAKTTVAQGATRITIPDLANGEVYTFSIRPEGISGPEQTVSSMPRRRDGCRFVSFSVWDPTFSFFCSFSAFDEYLRERSIDPLSLRCRGNPVQTWGPHSANCAYEHDQQQLLLLRAADHIPSFASVSDAGTVRAVARHALWPDGDPYSSPHRFQLDRMPIAPYTGSVVKYARARGYLVKTHPQLASRITWFEPINPAAMRFAIYLEGHGGALGRRLARKPSSGYLLVAGM